MVLVNSFFFLIFSLTSLIWWVPVVLLLFLPFMVAKKIKARVETITAQIERFSNQKLRQFKSWQKIVVAGRKLERKSKSLYQRFSNKLYQKTVWWQRMEILEAVPYKAKVLDIGCGNGYLAELVAKNKKAEVTCVDIEDFNQTEIPTILFDGVNLPFADKEFDVVILSYVLHHSEFQEELLAEAARVCRGEILIVEDEVMEGTEEIMANAHSKIWNFLSEQNGKVTYHSPDQWREIFGQSNLEILEEKQEWGIGSLAIPLKRAIFVLKSKN